MNSRRATSLHLFYGGNTVKLIKRRKLVILRLKNPVKWQLFFTVCNWGDWWYVATITWTTARTYNIRFWIGRHKLELTRVVGVHFSLLITQSLTKWYFSSISVPELLWVPGCFQFRPCIAGIPAVQLKCVLMGCRTSNPAFHSLPSLETRKLSLKRTDLNGIDPCLPNDYVNQNWLYLKWILED